MKYFFIIFIIITFISCSSVQICEQDKIFINKVLGNPNLLFDIKENFPEYYNDSLILNRCLDSNIVIRFIKNINKFNSISKSYDIYKFDSGFHKSMMNDLNRDRRCFNLITTKNLTCYQLYKDRKNAVYFYFIRTEQNKKCLLYFYVYEDYHGEYNEE